MKVRAWWVMLTTCGMSLPSVLSAQRVDPIQDLLNTGRQAYEDVTYAAADSIARLVLTQPGLRRSHRILAYQLEAAARFPPVAAERNADSALGALRQLIRISPLAPLPRTMTWPGLDSLLLIARRTTFGIAASASDTNYIEGMRGQVSIDVVASRPARFVVRISRLESPGTTEVIDSLGSVERGTLRFAPVVTELPRFRSGSYRIVITATDPSTNQSIDVAYQAAFETPPVQHVLTGVERDSAKFVAERTNPARRRSILSGAIVGAFVYAAGRVLRPSEIRGTGIPAPSGATKWGIGLGLGTIGISWFLDRGNPIEENIKFNEQLRKSWDLQEQRNLDQNELYKVRYQGLVRLTAEER